MEMKKYMDQYESTRYLCMYDDWLVDIKNERNKQRILASWNALVYKIKFQKGAKK